MRGRWRQRHMPAAGRTCNASQLARQYADVPAKLPAEMADIFEPHLPDDFLNRNARRQQQLLGPLNSPAENVLPRRDAGCRLEFAAEMIAAEIADSGERLKRQRVGKMRLDIFAHL